MARKFASISIRIEEDMAAAIKAASIAERRNTSEMLRILAYDGLRQRGYLFKNGKLVSVPPQTVAHHE